MVIHDPETWEITPEGRAGLVEWSGATIKYIYPEMGSCPISPINAKWNITDKWLSDDQDIYPLNMHVTQVMVNVLIKKAPIIDTLCNFMVTELKSSFRSLIRFAVSASLYWSY